MSWSLVGDVIAGGCLLAGAFLSLTAAVGALRLNSLLTRMHAVTKPQVLGMLLLLIGLAARLLDPSALGLLLLTGVFQLLTGPVAAHMVGRAAYRLNQTDDEVIVADDVERGPGGP
ncbi:MAG: monovalent cation/H(+) antiporter subunit G [Actinomycetota bacterium]